MDIGTAQRILQVYSRTDAKKAEEWLQRMQEFSLRPTILAKVSEQAGTPQGVRERRAKAPSDVLWAPQFPARAEPSLSVWPLRNFQSCSQKMQLFLERSQPDMALLCLLPMVQAGFSRLPHAAVQALVDTARQSLRGLLQAEALLELLFATQPAVFGEFLGEACAKVAEVAMDAGQLLQAERMLEVLWRLGRRQRLQRLRARLVKLLCETQVPKAEAWLTQWLQEGTAPSSVVACLCRAFLRSPYSYYQAEWWLEAALERGLRLHAADFAPIQAVLATARKSQERPYIWSSRIAKCTEADHMELAEEWAKLSLMHAGSDASVYKAASTVLMTGWGRQGQVDKAIAWLDMMLNNNLQVDNQCFQSSIDACARAQQVSKASQLLTTMRRHQLEPNAYNYSAVINACAEAKSFEAAESWLETGSVLNTACYNAVIKSCTRARAADRAILTLYNMTRRGLSPDVISFNSAITACVGSKSNAVKKAESVLEIMRQATVEASAVTFKSLIDVCAKSGDVPRAEFWYSKMAEAGFELDLQTLRMLMNASATSGDVQRTEWWFHASSRSAAAGQMEYNVMMKACVEAGQIQEAEQWYLKMREAGCPPGQATFGILANGRASLGDLEGVRFWLQQYQDQVGPLSLVLHNTFLKACAAKRKMSTPSPSPAEAAALERFQRIVREGFEVNHITLLALRAALGKGRARAVCRELGIENSAQRRSSALPFALDEKSMSPLGADPMVWIGDWGFEALALAGHGKPPPEHLTTNPSHRVEREADMGVDPKGR